MQIRTYEGSDPLELWCEYISWVEQSFPKHGPEGNLSVLLTKCFQAFKDEEKYKNDIRFVRLWIKYVSGCFHFMISFHDTHFCLYVFKNHSFIF